MKKRTAMARKSQHKHPETSKQKLKQVVVDDRKQQTTQGTKLNGSKKRKRDERTDSKSKGDSQTNAPSTADGNNGHAHQTTSASNSNTSKLAVTQVVTKPTVSVDAGSNWKRLQAQLEVKKRRKVERQSSVIPVKLSIYSSVAVKTETNSVTDLRFISQPATATKPTKNLDEVIAADPPQLGKKKLPIDHTQIVAMDCEMVGVGATGKQSALARCSIVDFNGNVLYDRFVRPKERITDYRTKYSGIRPKDLYKAVSFEECVREVGSILKGKILVGHALQNDSKVLFLDHPKRQIRDTAKFKPLMVLRVNGTKLRPQSLKKLAESELGVSIQEGEHDSVIDARATLAVYKKYMFDWEYSLLPGGHKIIDKLLRKMNKVSKTINRTEISRLSKAVEVEEELQE